MTDGLPAGMAFSIDMFDPETVEQAEKGLKRSFDATETDAAQYLERRRMAYVRVFGDLESEDVKLVLEDLALFCRAHSTAFSEDPRKHAALEGRREVYYRIADHVKLPRDLLYERYVAVNLERNSK